MSSKTLFVHVDLPSRFHEATLSEGYELCEAAGLFVSLSVRFKRTHPEAKLYVGRGQADALKKLASHVDSVVMNHALSATQKKFLSEWLCLEVVDRNELILAIFAKRAKTHAGKLQVELAQLAYLSTRLIRGWTHLERQKGGIGLRGPGETQLETDRRLIRDRMKLLKLRLERLKKQRRQSRRKRERSRLPFVAMVGYTNAGKSTLFNAMTKADVFCEDQVFATLDPTNRRLYLEGVGPVVISDTVGFIHHLPPQLLEAFQSTLEEVMSADLLLHVIDGSQGERRAQVEADVMDILQQMGAGDLPILRVYTKMDALDEPWVSAECNEMGVPEQVCVSALHHTNLERLMNDDE